MFATPPAKGGSGGRPYVQGLGETARKLLRIILSDLLEDLALRWSFFGEFSVVSVSRSSKKSGKFQSIFLCKIRHKDSKIQGTFSLELF